MAKLENSKRRLHQTVYAQVKLRGTNGTSFKPHKNWAKVALVTAAKPSQLEIAEVRAQLQHDLNRTDLIDPKALQAELAALHSLEPILARRNNDVSGMVRAMEQIEVPTLVALGERLIQMRTGTMEKALETHAKLAEAYSHSFPTHAAPLDNISVPPGYQQVGAVPHVPGAILYRRQDSEQPSLVPDTRSTPASRLTNTRSSHIHTLMVHSRPPATAKRMSGSSSATLGDVADWAIAAGWDPAQVSGLVGLAQHFSLNPKTLPSSDFQHAVMRQLDHAHNVLAAFKNQAETEPVGFLHLERLTFAPDGIERGELVYSVPLSPGEEVNIAHKEWSNTTEEFQRIVTDSLEDFSETGVTEKSELTQSTTSQHAHSNGISTGVSAVGGYGPVSISSSLGVSIADSASATAQFSRTQSIDVTRKASSRSKKEHKLSFKVASAAGTEDQTVRRIRNPYPDKATRVDYYQLIRKWEVNAYRYGIRLTYDITIPEPGSDILSRIKEIADLRDALDQGFGATTDLPWAQFDLAPDGITRENWTSLAAQYGAAPPPPPVEYKWFDASAQHQWKTDDEAKRSQFFALEVTVDDEYEIDEVSVNENHTVYLEENAFFSAQSIDDFFGASGKKILIYQAIYLGSLYVELLVRAKLRDWALREWQMKAWSAIRDAAQAHYYEQRQILKDRLATLTESLGSQDALSLRKIEREEIMKGVLRWLFGPDFKFVPSGIPEDLYEEDEAVVSKHWKEVLGQGDLIKFLHHAIEWENVLFFLYPYFWSHVSRWSLKKYLDHPDPMHTVFLKAGSARVVLTIRPGFERDFVSLLETGSFDGLSGGHPYLTIIEEMENFAKTNYPGIPPADPEQAAMNEQGVLIGTWHEYTPTSALDIAFNETMPTA